jgi:hypothetical protein
VPDESESVAVSRLTPFVTQPPPFGLFVVVALDVLPTNAVPPVNLPAIVLVATDSYVTARFEPVDVFPLFHLTDALAVPGCAYVRIPAQFSFVVSFSTKVRAPLVIPGVPVQPESVPLAVSVWATLTVGEIGGESVNVPANFVHVNTAAPPAGNVVVDTAGAVVVVPELLDEELLEHAARNAVVAINIAVVTTRCLRTCRTSVPAKMGGRPYIAIATFNRSG